MGIARFERQPDSKPDPIADLLCEQRWTKGVRTKRFVIRRLDPDRLIGEVWFDRCLHRVVKTIGVLDARRLASQFARETRDLEADGWSLCRIYNGADGHIGRGCLS
jgi:hypothetical protein